MCFDLIPHNASSQLCHTDFSNSLGGYIVSNNAFKSSQLLKQDQRKQGPKYRHVEAFSS